MDFCKFSEDIIFIFSQDLLLYRMILFAKMYVLAKAKPSNETLIMAF